MLRFPPEDRRAIEIVHSEAAQDRAFRADNEAVEQDFAALDHEVAGATAERRWLDLTGD